MSFTPLFVTKYECSGENYISLTGKMDELEQEELKNKTLVGSIYFDWGRIRLLHEAGPSVEKHTNITRRTITNEQYNKFKKERENFKGKSHADKVSLLDKLGASTLNINGSDRLIEVVDGHFHPSRGAPMTFTADAAAMRELCEFAERMLEECGRVSTRNNSLLTYLHDKGLAALLGYY